MHNSSVATRQKRCDFSACLRLSDRFTEPPQRVTRVKQTAARTRRPILDLGTGHGTSQGRRQPRPLSGPRSSADRAGAF
ncbi:hypothetical protein SBRY_20228 [Actinacidiphila bryophytorum]|uniref:Uncharacterized protein n=1 Tax=Actinacidiphila bryophytorum TaxID=1436133 RepID=A0A9W4EDN4_9ACTN|nr:hypothetical protein SBRY_20228 [Actinacidiphila bryophytorum]